MTNAVPQEAAPRFRISRGSRFSTVSETPASPPALASLDSAFQLQEYIAQLIKYDPHDVDTIVALPSTTSNARSQDIAKGESRDREDGPEVDVNCWIYEQLRRLAQDLTSPLIVLLQQECDRTTCPEMKAGEWLYLCVAHGNGGTMEQCCAIDYALHTLDAATAMLSSPRHFPSRISIPNSSVKHFSSLARRLSRIFAHAYFHHREAFEQAEAENALYERFLGLVRDFALVPPEYLVIPWENRPSRQDKAGTDTGLVAPAGDAPPAEDLDLTRSPGGSDLRRRRTDTMYFQGDFNVLDPAFGITPEGLPIGVGEEKDADEWVLPEREHGESALGVERDGIEVELEADPDTATILPIKQEGAAVAPSLTPSESAEAPIVAPPAEDTQIKADATFFEDVEEENKKETQGSDQQPSSSSIDQEPESEATAAAKPEGSVVIQGDANTVPDVEDVVVSEEKKQDSKEHQEAAPAVPVVVEDKAEHAEKA